MTLRRSDNLAKYTINMVHPKNDNLMVINLRGIYYRAERKVISDGFQDHEYLDLESISPCIHAQMMHQWGKV